jgi:glycosyltransferase involved in cell wall biosynthesis
MKLSVIITTYNSEEWLNKVLTGYLHQTEEDFEVIIADDGSTEKTKILIETFQGKFKHPIQHVWQEDNGFRKCKILNKAILKTNTDYLLFTDGDCIPRNDFVTSHLRHKENGYFLSGGYFKLPMVTSKKITENDIEKQWCFLATWLVKNGIQNNFKITKLTRNKWFARFMNWLTPTKKTFNGHNTSCFKKDLFAVNGFNENMQYGGLDRELGERMFNLGILAKQIRYSAICLHLDHSRGYFSQEEWDKNLKIRAYNIKNKIIETKNGLKQYL